jgi:hypothetical protein
MALLAGSCTISEDNVVSGTGLAKAMAEATMLAPPAGATANQCLEQWINQLAVAIVDHLVANAEVTVTVGAGDAGLQRTPNPNSAETATLAPAAPVNIGGTIA